MSLCGVFSAYSFRRAESLLFVINYFQQVVRCSGKRRNRKHALEQCRLFFGMQALRNAGSLDLTDVIEMQKAFVLGKKDELAMQIDVHYLLILKILPELA